MEKERSQSDLELINLYKSTGDQSHLVILYNDYRHLVYGLGLKYLDQKSDAEDLVLQIYEILFRKLKTHEVDNFKSWLYVVTKNYCFEKLRKKIRNREKENDAAIMYSEQVFHPDNVSDNRVDQLHRCLKLLNDEQRACIHDFYFDKKNYKQIAAIYNIKWNKVRSYIQNGRRMLKICIEKNG